MTKKILAVPLILLAVGCRDRYEGQAGAASSPSPSPYAEGAYASPGTMSGSVGDTGSITATVVSVDQSGRTITLREAGATGSAEGRRINVATTAATSLTGIQPGETVSVTCDNMAGAGTTGTGTTGTGTTGTGTTGTGAAGTGTTGYMGSGSLANCTTVTMITRSAGATGR